MNISRSVCSIVFPARRLAGLAVCLGVLCSLAGCPPGPDDAARELLDGMAGEESQYAAMLDRADATRFAHPGDQLADLALDWVRRLSSVSVTAQELSDALGSSGSEERSRARPDVVAVVAYMDALLSRDIAATLRIPAWRSTQIADAVHSVPAEMRSIRSYASTWNTYYPDVVGQGARPGAIMLGVVVDTALRDTFDECVEAYGNQDRGGDHTCRDAAAASCGHQMDMQCIQATIRLSVQGRPAGQAACYDTVSTAAGVSTVAAPWLAPSNFQACDSQAPVLNEGP